jgi:hypothetical protein
VEAKENGRNKKNLKGRKLLLWKNKQTAKGIKALGCHSPQTLNCYSSSLKRKYLCQDYICSNGFYKEITKISSDTVGNHRNLRL